jgi:glucokinase
VSAEWAIGVDLGGTKILAGLVSRDGLVERRLERPTPLQSESELVETLVEIVESFAPDGSSVGLGIPSTIDQRRGVATGSVNIPFEDVPLRDVLQERVRIPAGIENDGNAAALAEWKLGAGRGSTDMVMLTLGTGVGGGVVTDGRLFRGWAELGHVVIEHDGPPCFGECTGRGHLEALASGSAANRLAEETFGAGTTARELVDRAHGGEQVAVDALDRLGSYLGSAIGSFVNIFNAELIVIGGGFGIAAGDLVLDAARRIVEREVLAPARGRVRIVPAELGKEAGLVGAGLIGFEALAEAGS